MFLVGQYFVLSVVFIASALICFFVFKEMRMPVSIALAIAASIGIYFCLKGERRFARLITVSVCASLLLNTVLNFHFYPNLLAYQGGSSMSQLVKENNISVDKIYKIGQNYTWSLDFYNKRPVQLATLEEIQEKQDVWVYADAKELALLRDSGLDWDTQYSVDHFRITRLQAKFLNPDTRHKVLNKMYLIHVN
jgi:predicted PurR-regulated permease PerM